MLCRVCKQEKDTSCFTRIKGTDRYKTICKQCRREVEYPKTKEKMRDRARAYYRDNREDVLIKSRERRKVYRNREMVRSAKERAKKMGLPFNITAEDVIIPNYCPALGIPLKIGTGHPTPNSPSLDRIVPELGYTKGNVMVISHKANTIKNDATPEEIKRVADFYLRLKKKKIKREAEMMSGQENLFEKLNDTHIKTGPSEVETEDGGV